MTREEAIKEIREWDFTNMNKDDMEVLATLIPELAESESEDESIRKKLKEAFKAYYIKSTWHGIPIRSILAYLEKQKEQNQKITVKIPKFRVGDIIQHVPLERWDRSQKITSIDEHGYNYDLSHLGDNVSGGFIGFSFEDEYELVEQKPDWSEEDEEMRNLIVAIFEVNHPNDFFKANELGTTDMRGVHTKEIISWLKSLRPMPKVAIADGILWKPSEEQMNALNFAITYFMHETSYKNPTELRDLYEQLKKLM